MAAMTVDSCIHDALKLLKEVRWRDSIVPDVQWYYAEGGVYVIRFFHGTPREHMVVIRAKSPKKATSSAMPWIDMKKARCALCSIMEDVGDYSLEGLDVVWCGIKGESLRMAKKAISHNPRQCDVGTADDQAKRFEKFCSDHQEPWHGCTNCPVLMSEKCDLAWAQMPYVDEGDGKHEQK